MSLIKNLNKSYEDFVIQINEWNLSDQGVTVLWGVSGAGKTTVIRLLTGLEECEGMSWMRNGVDLAKLPSYQRGVSVVFQHLALFPHMTSIENIYFPLDAQKIPRQSRAVELKEMVDFLELDSFLEKRVDLLSGGQKQRVALARALILNPNLLILDEPFTALDLQLKKQARQLVQKIVETRKIPVLLVTHDPLDAQHLAQQVIILEKGRIKTSQTVQDFLKSMN